MVCCRKDLWWKGVLSRDWPALFLLVVDRLLRRLQASGLGLTVNRFYAGGFLHADDIRTLAMSEESLQQPALSAV